jgi:hypothetical protein
MRHRNNDSFRKGDPDMSAQFPSIAPVIIVSAIAASCMAGDPGLSLWETGGMYFSVPYGKGTEEIDLNAWHEDGAPGFSLYGSHAFSDNSTLKLEVPFSFESAPYVNGVKVSGLFGLLSREGTMSLSGDANLEYLSGEGWQDVKPTLGCNFGKRWGTFALLTRISGGVSRQTENNRTSSDGVFEAEAGPFIYTGDFGMVGLPLMFEYGDNESSVNCALDWEIYLPGGFSLWVVPRYEVMGGSGFSIWNGIAWMKTPE